MKIIDFHTHIFPDKIADKTIAKLSAVCGMPPFTNGKEEGLIHSMEMAGISCSVILPVATSPSQFKSINEFALNFQTEPLVSLGGIHPDSANYKEELKYLKSVGIKGIKLHPDYQGVYFDDIRFKRLISYASELDLIVLVHGGVDPLCPEDVHCTPEMVCEMVEEVHPTKLVIAHMAGNLRFDDVERYLVGKNIYLDTSYVLDKMDMEQFHRIVQNHGANRILFGSDSPWGEQSAFVNCLHALNLSDEDKELIAHKNAERLLGL